MTSIIHPPTAALQVVLLDVDGTLIDSNDGHARAWVAALATRRYQVPFEKVRPLIGMGGDKILPLLTGLHPESPEAEAIGEARAELFRTEELPSLRPTRGARALLERVLAAGLELVVATSAQEAELGGILEQAGVSDLIKIASSSDDASESKPDPDIILAALAKAGRQAGHAIMIGDTPYDVEAAGRARVATIALRCGGGWGDEAFSGALAIYDDPGDLRTHFDASPLARPGR